MLIFKKNRDPGCICVKIKGGLGNQMFQYAAGLAVAKRNSAELLLELPAIGREDHASFGLDLFNLDANCFKISMEADSIGKVILSKLQFLKSEKDRLRYEKDSEIVNSWNGQFFEQTGFAYDTNIEGITSPCLMDGYFQSEKYFESISSEVRKAFDLGHLLNGMDNELRSACMEPNSVSVHIRRGDYAKNPEITTWHGLIGKDYYNRSKNLLEESGRNRTYLVFSDDPEEAGSITADWSNVRIITGNNREIDLLAMTLCQDHVIANSTFSWWGAWLDPNPAKKVISPCKWLLDETSNQTLIADLIPENWILL